MRKKKHPVVFLIIGICILIIPTVVYLCFLVPQLSEEYNVLMSSGGIIGGAGVYGANKIPDKLKYSSMFKLAANSFTIMTVILLVEKFIVPLIGLIATFIVSFIIFKILMEVYRNARTSRQNRELAEAISQSVAKVTK